MNTKQKIDKLWDETRQYINAAYAEAEKTYTTFPHGSNPGSCLRDYAEDISWSDSMRALLGRETANERQHRSNRPSIPGFSNESAAKLILMGNIEFGTRESSMPQATEFLVVRQTAAEARVIGYLIQEHVTDDWRNRLAELDYSALMKAGA